MALAGKLQGGRGAISVTGSGVQTSRCAARSSSTRRRDLAGRAYLSRYHYDRLVSAALGEPPGRSLDEPGLSGAAVLDEVEEASQGVGRRHVDDLGASTWRRA